MKQINLDSKVIAAAHLQRKYSIKIGATQAHMLSLNEIISAFGRKGMDGGVMISKLCELEVNKTLYAGEILVVRTE
jgi:hypothetical protein